MDTTLRRFGGERRPKDKVTLQIILGFTLTLPKTFTQGRVSVCDKYLHWPCISVIKIYIHCKRISLSVIKFGRVSVHDLHLHWICTSYIWLLTRTHAQHW
jgi:hypothetical protein